MSRYRAALLLSVGLLAGAACSDTAPSSDTFAYAREMAEWFEQVQFGFLELDRDALSALQWIPDESSSLAATRIRLPPLTQPGLRVAHIALGAAAWAVVVADETGSPAKATARVTLGHVATLWAIELSRECGTFDDDWSKFEENFEDFLWSYDGYGAAMRCLAAS